MIVRLAQQDLTITDNLWPESFRFPFGEWIKQLVFWAVNNPVTAKIGEIIEWPFKTFFDLIMSETVGRESIMTIPWIWLVAATFVIASFTRNTRVGLQCAGMLAICGFLGPEYWTETAKTIGMIIVSVTLCAIVGVPLGILSGRFDAVWNVVRPTLDAMQVVHSFVFMLPFIFFFSIGEVSATMVTMVFALPPLVRLTNLGIRQVPEDVVEASRAYGATEVRVLTDVQLPLARPAIMTGLNQTLLLAISMLGIAALMGAGGLGRLLFRAINNLDLGLASSAGLAFFLVAVILDRISQNEGQQSTSLLTNIRNAWAFRANPEGLLENQELAANQLGIEAEVAEEPDEQPAPVGATERLGLLIGAAGSLAALVALFLPWGSNAGLVSSWGRYADESANGELAGLSFNGWEASGGTFFGIFVGLFALFGLFAGLRPLLRFPASLSKGIFRIQGLLLGGIVAIIAVQWLLNLFNQSLGLLSTIGLAMFFACAALVLVEMFISGANRLGADGLLISAIGLVGSALGYLLLRPSEFTVGYSHGFGVWLAVIGGVAATVGGLIAIGNAPFGPRRPLPVSIAWGRVVASVLALLLIVGSAFGVGDVDRSTEYGWYFDDRIESIQRQDAENVPPDIQAEIARLREEAGDDVNMQIVNAQRITNLINTLQTGDRVVHNGVESEGPGLGWIAIILAAAAVAISLPAAGVLGAGESRKWRAAALLSGIGLAIMAIPMGFVLGIVRVAEGSNPVAGIGAFMTFLAGFIILASGRGVVAEFRRRKIYADVARTESMVDEIPQIVEEPALASVT